MSEPVSTPVNPRDSHSSETRNRLLEAAGEVFAEQGYRAATIRDIRAAPGPTSRPSITISATRNGSTAKSSSSPSRGGAATTRAGTRDSRAEEQLAVSVRAFVGRVFDTGKPAWHEKLMSREMIEPTPALAAFVEQDIRPRHERLTRLVRRLAGEAAGDDAVRRCATSIIGQVLFYHHARPVLDRLYPRQTYAPAELDALADHITRFSLAGIAAVAENRPVPRSTQTQPEPA